MSPLPKMMEPDEALRLAFKMMRDAGFFKVSTGTEKSSFYFRKSGSIFKIRFSTHPAPSRYHDVLYMETFDTRTIEPDVVFRVQRAIKVYNEHLQNLRRKTE